MAKANKTSRAVIPKPSFAFFLQAIGVMLLLVVRAIADQSVTYADQHQGRLLLSRQLTNAIRGYAAEFGLTAAKGKGHLGPLLERTQADESLPALARELFAAQAKEYVQLQAQIDEVDARLMSWHRADECGRRLAKIPGIGPIGAVLLKMKTRSLSYSDRDASSRPG